MTPLPESGPPHREFRRIAELAALIRNDARSAGVGTIRELVPGELILAESATNHMLWLVVEGAVTLRRGRHGQAPVMVDELPPGSLLGLISYCTGGVTMTEARAEGPTVVHGFQREDMATLATVRPQLKALIDELIIFNLANRYQRVVEASLRANQLAEDLENERDLLWRTVEDLRTTRGALVSRERMAMLGQLVAGVAHELNNPVAAVGSAAESLRDELAGLIDEEAREWLIIGQASVPGGHEAHRARMNQLVDDHPGLGRADARVLAHAPVGKTAALTVIAAPHAAAWMRIGMALRGIDAGTGRVARLVRGLKSYSREGWDSEELADVVEGIRDTLVILGNQLRRIEVDLVADEIPPVKCRPGALNQVWTNLIVNACEAMNGRGRLEIRAQIMESNRLRVTIADSGPGIPEGVKDRIFELNFTTKTGKRTFGLGIGLSISRDIITSHGGTLSVMNRPAPGHGAVFEVELPV